MEARIAAPLSKFQKTVPSGYDLRPVSAPEDVAPSPSAFEAPEEDSTGEVSPDFYNYNDDEV